jgi:hypothetical protein
LRECLDNTDQFYHREGRVRRRHGIRSLRLSVLNFLLPFFSILPRSAWWVYIIPLSKG